MLTHVAGKLEMDIEQLYETVAWPLGTKFGHAYDAFKLSIRCVGERLWRARWSYWVHARQSG